MNLGKNLIPVVLVENIPALQRHMQKSLGLIDHIELINTSMSAQEGLDAIRDLKPEVVLIEYNLPDMNGIHLTEAVRRDYPGTQVVLISQDNYTDIVLQAVRAGACDFTTHDVSVKELTDVIKRASVLAQQERQKLSFPMGPTPTVKPGDGKKGGKVVAVYSPKGGAGTTTIAANLALGLMDLDVDARVALVDGSMQYGDAHLFFNELGQLSVMDLVPRVYELDIQLVENVMVLNRASGLYILPAPPRPEFAEKISGENFAAIIEFLRKHYEYIVVNTDSYISEPVLACLDAADCVVLVTTQQVTAIRATRLFLELWDAFGMTRDRVALVVNRYNPNNPITTDRIGERLKHAVSNTLSDAPEVCTRADALGQPFMRSGKDSVIAKEILALAEHTKKRSIAVANVEEPRLRLFGVAA